MLSEPHQFLLWPPALMTHTAPLGGSSPWNPQVEEAQGPFRFTTSKPFLLRKLHPSPPLHRNKGKRLTYDPSSPPHGARARSGFLSCWAEAPYQMKCLHQLQLQTTHSNDRLAEAVLLSQQKLSKSLSQENLLKVTAVSVALPLLAPFPQGHLRKDKRNLTLNSEENQLRMTST